MMTMRSFDVIRPICFFPNNSIRNHYSPLIDENRRFGAYSRQSEKKERNFDPILCYGWQWNSVVVKLEREIHIDIACPLRHLYRRAGVGKGRRLEAIALNAVKYR